MAQSDVFALIDDLAGTRSDGANLADPTLRSRYYTEVVFEHGLMRESAMDAAFVAVVVGTAEYTQPAAAIRTIAICHDATELRPTLRRGLEAYDPSWRSRRGTPRSYTAQDADDDAFRLVPVPASSGATIGTSTPFIGTFPDGNLTFVYTDNVTDVPLWDELWVALEVLSREFARESDHFDVTFAQTAQALAAVVRQLVGYGAERPRNA